MPGFYFTLKCLLGKMVAFERGRHDKVKTFLNFRASFFIFSYRASFIISAEEYSQL